MNRKWDFVFPQSGPPGVAWAARLRAATASRIVYTGHGGIGPGEERVLALRPDAYVAISRAAFEWARLRSGTAHYIPNGVDTDRFSVAPRMASVPVILSVGALVSFKRHELTIRAVELIPDVKLRIVGAGEMQEALEAECRQRIPGRYVVEQIDHASMPAVYSEAALFTLPSAAEPMGLVYLEALACGLPCVVPDDPLRRELLQDQAIYTDVEDAAAYAGAIRRGLTAPASSAERSGFVKRHYSWEKSAARYINLFEELERGTAGTET